MTIDRSRLKPIPHIASRTCFGCGENNPIGLHMQFLSDEERMFSFLQLPTHMGGWDHTAHGGILSTVLDEIMGWSCIYLLRKIGLTKSITVDFLKPTYVDQELTVIGGIEHVESERVAYLQAEIQQTSTGLVSARATAKFATLSAKAALRLGVMREEYLALFEPILGAYQD